MLNKIMNWFKAYNLKQELLDNNKSRCFDLNDLTAEELNALMA